MSHYIFQGVPVLSDYTAFSNNADLLSPAQRSSQQFSSQRAFLSILTSSSLASAQRPHLNCRENTFAKEHRGDTTTDEKKSYMEVNTYRAEGRIKLQNSLASSFLNRQ